MDDSTFTIVLTNLLCTSIYTSFCFTWQIIIIPLLNEKWYGELQDRTWKAFGLFQFIEMVTAIILCFISVDLIAPAIMLFLNYIPIVLIFRLEEKFISRLIINEDYDYFRVYGWIRCFLSFSRWVYLYVYILLNN